MNPRPHAPKARALPSCATLRKLFSSTRCIIQDICARVNRFFAFFCTFFVFSFSSSAKFLLYPFPVTVPYFHNHLFLILPQDFLQYYLSFPNNSEDNSCSSLLVLFFYVITSTLLPISSLFRSLVTTIFFSIRSFSSETWEMIPTRRLPSVSPCNAVTA